MKKIKTPIKKSKRGEEYQLLVYIVKCETRIKKFATEKEMGQFIDGFLKEHPEYQEEYSENWIDFALTGVTGDVHFFTDGVAVE
jgi:hypothetical protein